MTKRIGKKTGTKNNGKKRPGFVFSINLLENNVVIVEGSESLVTINDVVFRRIVGSTIDTKPTIVLGEVDLGSLVGSFVFSSSDENIATIDQNGITSRVSDGFVRFIVENTTTGYVSVSSIFRFLRSNSTTDIFYSFVSDSLAKHCSDAIDTRIAGKNKVTHGLIHNGTSYNTNRWCSDLDLTGVIREIPRCTAITPRHVVMAEHYQKAGAISFLASDNTIVTRNIIRRQNVGPSNSSDDYRTDITIGLLDQDLPASIKHYKLLPSNVSGKLPSLQRGIPALCFDQEEKALVTDLFSFSFFSRAYFQIPTNETRLLFYEAKISGDSGNPAFLIINDEPILVTTWTFGGPGSGPVYHNYISEINTAISQVDTAQGINTGYTLTTVDLSGFPTY